MTEKNGCSESDYGDTVLGVVEDDVPVSHKRLPDGRLATLDTKGISAFKAMQARLLDGTMTIDEGLQMYANFVECGTFTLDALAKATAQELYLKAQVFQANLFYKAMQELAAVIREAKKLDMLQGNIEEIVTRDESTDSAKIKAFRALVDRNVKRENSIHNAVKSIMAIDTGGRLKSSIEELISLISMEGDRPEITEMVKSLPPGMRRDVESLARKLVSSDGVISERIEQVNSELLDEAPIPRKQIGDKSI